MVSPNPNFGERLRAERETRGVTLEEIADRTRVSVRLLRSIETEKFDELPGGIFNIAFVRQYAHYAGLDEDAVVEEFKRLTQPAEAAIVPELRPEDRGATLVEGVVERAQQYQVTAPIVLTLLLALVAGAVIFAQWDWDSGFSAMSETILGEDWESDGATTTTASTPTNAGVTPYVEPKPVKAVHVELSMTATVWIRAIADGRRVFQRTFRSGDSESVEADENVHLLLGNAGGVAVSLNGDAQPPVGTSGQVRRVVLTKRGMEILQPPSKGGESDSPRTPQVQASMGPSGGASALARGVTPSN